jgi:tRNA threonylcarbamoyl adenosine modification protein (Sua5/YciO/YrdC/YwlC family)
MDVIEISLQNINKPFLINRLETIIKENELLVYPTDTLYGIGADPYSQKCIEKINQLKGRGEELNISIAVASFDSLKKMCDTTLHLEQVCTKLLPGPITVILNAGPSAPVPVVSKTGTIGVRIPDNPVTLELLKITGPLTATSANLHGGADPVDIKTAGTQLGDSIQLYLDSGPCRLEHSSTILDLTTETPKILREGHVSRSMIEEQIGHKVI